MSDAAPSIGRDVAEHVIREIREALVALVEQGHSHAIDLRHLPHMRPEDYAFLKDTLGAGEVTAVVNTAEKVEIAETGVAGVWWITYRRASEAIATEMIEVAFIPKILIAGKAQVAAAAKRLEARHASETKASAS